MPKCEHIRYAVLGVLLLVLTAIVYLLYCYYGKLVFTALSSIGNIALTTLLVFLYFQQTRLMQEQQQFERGLERPVVHIEGHRPGQSEGDYSTRPLEILVSNIGRSPATDLTLEIISGFPEDSRFSSARATAPLRRKDETDDWNRDWSTYLEDADRNVRYLVEPVMIGWHDESEEKSVTNPISKGYGLVHQVFTSKQVDTNIRLQGRLIYEGVDGRQYSEMVFDRVVELVPYGDIGTALERGVNPNTAQTTFLITDNPPDASFD